MVGLADVEHSNAQFAAQKHTGKVAVFVGATNGIGEATLEVLVSLLQTPTFYVVGRSASRFEPQRARLAELNANAKIIFIEDEISLIAGVDRACKQIQETEDHIDYLYMSAGYLPVTGPEYTSEGLETSFSVSYFARMRFVSNLLPLLRKASNARVLNLLNCGKEKKLHEDDLGLIKSWGMWEMVGQSTTMSTLSLQHLSEQEHQMVFMHAFPGFVNTVNPRRRQPPTPPGILQAAYLKIIAGLMAVAWYFMAIAPIDSAKRQAYHLTNERYTPGMWRIDNKCEPWGDTSQTKVVEEYKKRGWPGRVWDFTVSEWERALSN